MRHLGSRRSTTARSTRVIAACLLVVVVVAGVLGGVHGIDVVTAPTTCILLADLSAHMLRAARANPALTGTYHAVAGGETSWHAYARFVIEYARAHGVDIKVAADQILAIPTSSYPTPAARPLNSRLATGKLQQRFGLKLPHWQYGVERMLEEIL